MQRLYLLVPDVERAKRLVDALQEANVEEQHIHLVAKDEGQLERAHLHHATLLQKAEFLPAVEKGAAAGGVTGLLAGIGAMTFPPAGVVVGGGALLGMGLLGAGLGAWIAGNLDAAEPEHKLQEFEQAVEEGNLLLLVDVPKQRVEEISELLTKHQDQWLRELAADGE